MATDPGTAEFILDTVAGAGAVAVRKMFGEYALYCDGKVVGLICDDTLFLKPVPEVRAILTDADQGAPYPGAKTHLRIESQLDDPDLMARLVRTIADALPEPKPKKPRPKKPRTAKAT